MREFGCLPFSKLLTKLPKRKPVRGGHIIGPLANQMGIFVLLLSGKLHVVSLADKQHCSIGLACSHMFRNRGLQHCSSAISSCILFLTFCMIILNKIL